MPICDAAQLPSTSSLPDQAHKITGTIFKVKKKRNLTVLNLMFFFVGFVSKSL